MTFDPFEKKQFSDKEVKLLFGPHSDAKLAVQTKVENPALYAQVRSQAEGMGLVGPPGPTHAKGKLAVQVMSPKPVPTQHSDEDLRLMLLYPKSATDRIFKGPSNNDPQFIFAKHTPEEQADIHSAAVLHNSITGEVRHRRVVVDAVVPDESRVAAGVLGAVAGICESEMITPSQYAWLVAAKSQLDAARSPLQVAEDHAADVQRTADIARKQADDLKGGNK